jgi:hypothetical protein
MNFSQSDQSQKMSKYVTPNIIITPPPDIEEKLVSFHNNLPKKDRLKLVPPSRRSSMIFIVPLSDGDWLVQPLDLKLLTPEHMPKK